MQPGVATEELDRLCHEYIVGELGSIPAPLNYRGSAGAAPFPKSICTSVNHVVCHGIPSDRTLRNGDIVNIDVTVIKDGYHGDTSRMFMVGAPSIMAERLTQGVLRRDVARHPRDPPRRAGSATSATRSRASSRSSASPSCASTAATASAACSTRTRRCCTTAGPAPGVELVPGMTITVEPMVNAGKREVKLLSDGWTVVTKDHSLSAQWEHTVLVTGHGLRGADAEPGRSRLVTTMSNPEHTAAPLIDRGALEQALRGDVRAVKAFRDALKVANDQLGERFRRNEAIETLVARPRARRRRGHPRELAALRRRACSTRRTSSPSAVTAAASCIRNPTSTCSFSSRARRTRPTTRSAGS